MSKIYICIKYIYLHIHTHICICIHLSVQCGGREAEEPAVEIDVCRNADGAMECTVHLAGLVVFG